MIQTPTEVVRQFLASTTNPTIVKSLVAEKTVESPFSILSRVHDGKIVYFQFMEDTFATAASFKSGGSSIFHSDPNGKEIEI